MPKTSPCENLIDGVAKRTTSCCGVGVKVHRRMSPWIVNTRASRVMNERVATSRIEDGESRARRTSRGSMHDGLTL